MAPRNMRPERIKRRPLPAYVDMLNEEPSLPFFALRPQLDSYSYIGH